jgi:hypothetical protein
LMKAECAALRSKEKKISPSGTRLLRLALIWGWEPPTHGWQGL